MNCKHDLDTCPENYILLGNPDFHRSYGNFLVSEAQARFPECFEGNEKSFPFELRYVAPFDKEFYELKRLQGMAAEVAGRRDAFRGYIVIDLSNYLTHSNEHYLEITLRFLIDMNDCWKYIFLVSNKDSKAARELVGKVLTIVMHDISVEVKAEDEDVSFRNRINDICKKNGITCSTSAKNLILNLVEQERFNEDTISILLEDIARHDKNRLSLNTFTAYISKEEPPVKYLLSAKEYSRLISVVKQRKEEWYGEKEAV